MTYFTYNGRSSADFGLRIERKDVFSGPEYDMEFQSIPGRSGDLIVSNNRFANLKVTYTVFFARKDTASLADAVRAIKAWLYREPDRYHSITDSYDPGYIRYGVFKGGLEMEEQLNKVGYFTVSFSCKPFRCSEEGRVELRFATNNVLLKNPEGFAAQPIITVKGAGTVRLIVSNAEYSYNGIWTMADFGGEITCDSERMNFYRDTILLNDKVKGDGFPLLYPGENDITVEGDASEIIVTPRWCSL